MRRMGGEHNATEKNWLKSNLKQTALTVRLIAFRQIASFRNKLFNRLNDEADRCFAVRSNFRHLRLDDAGQVMNIFPLGFHNNIDFEVSVVSGVSAHHHESSVRPSIWWNSISHDDSTQGNLSRWRFIQLELFMLLFCLIDFLCFNQSCLICREMISLECDKMTNWVQLDWFGALWNHKNASWCQEHRRL